MTRETWICGSLFLCLAVGWARSETNGRPLPSPAEQSRSPLILVQNPQAPPPPPETPAPAQPDAFAQAPAEQGGEAPASFSPPMVGDFPAVFACRTITVPAVQVINGSRIVTVVNAKGVVTRIVVPVPPTTVATFATQTVCVPFASYGGFKIAENESPQPQDRVFFAYNFYSDVSAPSTGAGLPRTQTVATTIGGLPATITTQVPGVPTPTLDVHREAFGFEKAFLDGNASIGLRAPITQVTGDGGFGASDFGDMTVILKYALYNDPDSRNLISAGLGVTAPTGPGIETVTGTVRSTLLQPYSGFIWNGGDFYVHGFTSAVFPTDPRDVTILFNDVGVGYWLYRNRAAGTITSIVPTFEVHVNTPINHHEATAPISIPDVVDLTAGVQVGLLGRWGLTLGVVTPVTGPRPFEVEAVAQFNRMF